MSSTAPVRKIPLVELAKQAHKDGKHNLVRMYLSNRKRELKKEKAL